MSSLAGVLLPCPVVTVYCSPAGWASRNQLMSRQYEESAVMQIERTTAGMLAIASAPST
jgi:hypothetical protein